MLEAIKSLNIGKNIGKGIRQLDNIRKREVYKIKVRRKQNNQRLIRELNTQRKILSKLNIENLVRNVILDKISVTDIESQYDIYTGVIDYNDFIQIIQYQNDEVFHISDILNNESKRRILEYNANKIISHGYEKPIDEALTKLKEKVYFNIYEQEATISEHIGNFECVYEECKNERIMDKILKEVREGMSEEDIEIVEEEIIKMPEYISMIIQYLSKAESCYFHNKKVNYAKKLRFKIAEEIKNKIISINKEIEILMNK